MHPASPSTEPPLNGGPTLAGLLAAATALVLLLVAGPGLAQVGSVADDVPGVSDPPWGAWVASSPNGTPTEKVEETDQSHPTAIDLTSDDRRVFMYEGRPPGYGFPTVRILAETTTGWEEAIVSNKQAHPGDMAVDADDTVHTVFQVRNKSTPTEADLNYSHGTVESGFTKEPVATNVDFFSASIAMAPDGEPRFTRGGGSSGVYYHAPDGNGGWTETHIGGNGHWHDLAIDSQGRPHIAYYRAVNAGGTLAYAVNTSSGWQVTETVLEGCGTEISIAVDGNDTPHIACHLVGNGLEHVWKTSDGWAHETVDNGGSGVLGRPNKDVGHDTSIVVDDEDRVHIAYRYIPNFFSPRLAPGQPHYAVQVDGEWHVTTIDRDGQTNGYGTDLELDGEDRPHVSYLRLQRYTQGGGFPGSGHLQSKGDLRYARPAVAEAGVTAGAAAAWNPDSEDVQPTVTPHTGEEGWYGVSGGVVDRDATLRARPVTDGVNASVTEGPSEPVAGVPCGSDCEVGIDLPYRNVSAGGGDAGLVVDADGHRTSLVHDVPGATVESSAGVSPQAGEDGWYGVSAMASGRNASLGVRPVTEGANASVSEETPSPFLRIPCGPDCEVGVDIPHWSVSAGGGDVGVVVDVDGESRGVVVGVPGIEATLP